MPDWLAPILGSLGAGGVLGVVLGYRLKMTALSHKREDSLLTRMVEERDALHRRIDAVTADSLSQLETLRRDLGSANADRLLLREELHSTRNRIDGLRGVIRHERERRSKLVLHVAMMASYQTNENGRARQMIEHIRALEAGLAAAGQPVAIPFPEPIFDHAWQSMHDAFSRDLQEMQRADTEETDYLASLHKPLAPLSDGRV